MDGAIVNWGISSSSAEDAQLRSEGVPAGRRKNISSIPSFSWYGVDVLPFSSLQEKTIAIYIPDTHNPRREEYVRVALILLVLACGWAWSLPAVRSEVSSVFAIKSVKFGEYTFHELPGRSWSEEADGDLFTWYGSISLSRSQTSWVSSLSTDGCLPWISSEQHATCSVVDALSEQNWCYAPRRDFLQLKATISWLSLSMAVRMGIFFLVICGTYRI